MVFSQKLITTVIFVLKLIYLLPLFLAIIIILFVILSRDLLDLVSEQAQVTDSLSLLASCSIFYGLHGRKSWVVPLVVYLSGLGIFGLILYQPNSSVEALVKFLGLIFLVFKIYFFTRKEVKKYFNVKSLILFSR